MDSDRNRRRRVDVDGFSIPAEPEAFAEAFAGLRRRSVPTVRHRVRLVRYNLVLALQAGLAAALAWLAAYKLLGNPEPVFAPISAIGTIASSVGQRFRRTVELLVGVVLGIAVGDLLIFLFGTGPWQLGAIVFLAIVVTIFLGGGPAVVTQAAATAVLIVTLSPTVRNLEFPRVIDALVGGIVGLIVVALLLPLNPLRVADRAARPGLTRLAEELTETSDALANHDPGRAQAALDRLHEVEEHMDELNEALLGGRETTRFAPIYWRRREALARYAEGAVYINHAVHNSGTLIRRAVTAIEDGEAIPPSMPTAVSLLADAVRLLQHDLGLGLPPEGARERALRAVGEAARAYAEGVGFSGSVVIAQIRTTASDLIRATGVERAEANRMVRRAAAENTGIAAPSSAGTSGEGDPEPPGDAGPESEPEPEPEPGLESEPEPEPRRTGTGDRRQADRSS